MFTLQDQFPTNNVPCIRSDLLKGSLLEANTENKKKRHEEGSWKKKKNKNEKKKKKKKSVI